MSNTSFPCADGLPTLLLVEPITGLSLRVAQLGHQRFCVTQTDSMREIFLLRHIVRFKIAVLSDELGTAPLCAVAESVRWQWPAARILILGRIPAAMKDQLYDYVAAHSVDENAFLSAIDRIAEDPYKQKMDQLHRYLQGPGAPLYTARTMELQESDPTKFTARVPHAVYGRDLPSNRYRSHRRG